LREFEGSKTALIIRLFWSLLVLLLIAGGMAATPARAQNAVDLLASRLRTPLQIEQHRFGPADLMIAIPAADDCGPLQIAGMLPEVDHSG